MMNRRGIPASTKRDQYQRDTCKGGEVASCNLTASTRLSFIQLTKVTGQETHFLTGQIALTNTSCLYLKLLGM